MDRYRGPQLPLLYIALHGGLYFGIITDRYGGHHTPLNIFLHGGL
jgi:hypothetical protein